MYELFPLKKYFSYSSTKLLGIHAASHVLVLISYCLSRAYSLVSRQPLRRSLAKWLAVGLLYGTPGISNEQ